VVSDVAPSADEAIAKVLNEADPEGRWEWRISGCTGRPATRRSNRTSTPCAWASNKARGQAKRYIWGGGFIAARKVRFLHASMRVMLLNPG